MNPVSLLISGIMSYLIFKTLFWIYNLIMCNPYSGIDCTLFFKIN